VLLETTKSEVIEVFFNILHQDAARAFDLVKEKNVGIIVKIPLDSGWLSGRYDENSVFTDVRKRWKESDIQKRAMLVKRIKEIMPDCGISSDIISGFCTETEEDHLDTLDVMEKSGYDFSYMFIYSERPGTLAAKRYTDDVPEAIKKRRLQEIIAKQNKLSLQSNLQDIGKSYEVLIEGDSKKSTEQRMGRNSQNKVVVFSKAAFPTLKKGDYATVKVLECTQGTLIGA
jgi:tRNA A37 methylthiotransferase MiaB